MKSPNRHYNLGREGEIGLDSRAILTPACDKVLPVSKRRLKTLPGGKREIFRKVIKTYKNFYQWISERLLPCTWKPQTVKSFLVSAVYKCMSCPFVVRGLRGVLYKCFNEGSGASVWELWAWLPLSLLSAETEREVRKRQWEEMLRYWQLWGKSEQARGSPDEKEVQSWESGEENKKTAWSALFEWVFVSPSDFLYALQTK